MSEIKDCANNDSGKKQSTSKYSLRSQSKINERASKRSSSKHRSRSGDKHQKENGDGDKHIKPSTSRYSLRSQSKIHEQASKRSSSKHRSRSGDNHQKENDDGDKHKSITRDENQKENGDGDKHIKQSTSKYGLRSQSKIHERASERSSSKHRSRSGNKYQKENDDGDKHKSITRDENQKENGDGDKHRSGSGDKHQTENDDGDKHRSGSGDKHKKENGGRDKHKSRSGDKHQIENVGGDKHECKGHKRRRKCKSKARSKSRSKIKKVVKNDDDDSCWKQFSEMKISNCNKSKRQHNDRKRSGSKSRSRSGDKQQKDNGGGDKHRSGSDDKHKSRIGDKHQIENDGGDKHKCKYHKRRRKCKSKARSKGRSKMGSRVKNDDNDPYWKTFSEMEISNCEKSKRQHNDRKRSGFKSRSRSGDKQQKDNDGGDKHECKGRKRRHKCKTKARSKSRSKIESGDKNIDDDPYWIKFSEMEISNCNESKRQHNDRKLSGSKSRSRSGDKQQKDNSDVDKHRSRSVDKHQKESGGGDKHECKGCKRRQSTSKIESGDKNHDNDNCKKRKRQHNDRNDKRKKEFPELDKTYTGRVISFTELLCVVQLHHNDKFHQRLTLSHFLQPDQVKSSDSGLLKGAKVKVKVTSIDDDRVALSIQSVRKKSHELPMDGKDKKNDHRVSSVLQPTQTYDMIWIKKGTVDEENVDDSCDGYSTAETTISIYSDDLQDNDDDDTNRKKPPVKMNCDEPMKPKKRRKRDRCVEVNDMSVDRLTKRNVKMMFFDMCVSRTNIKLLKHKPNAAFVKFENSYDKFLAMTFNGKMVNGSRILVKHLDDDEYEKEIVDYNCDLGEKDFVWPDPTNLNKNMLKLVQIPKTVKKREILEAINANWLLAADLFAEDQSGLKAILVFSTDKTAELTMKWHRSLFLTTPVPFLRCTDEDVCQFANRIKTQPSLIKSLVLKRKPNTSPSHLSPLRIKLLLREFSEKFNRI